MTTIVIANPAAQYENPEYTGCYSTDINTMLRICEVANNVFVREDGMYKSIRRDWHTPCKRGGYCRVSIESTGIDVHRLVARAFIPNPDNLPYVDHINHNQSDNRIANLRWVTARQNSQNLKKHANKLVGCTKRINKNSIKYEALFRADGKVITLGRFNTEEEAHKAYIRYLEVHNLR